MKNMELVMDETIERAKIFEAVYSAVWVISMGHFVVDAFHLFLNHGNQTTQGQISFLIILSTIGMLYQFWKMYATLHNLDTIHNQSIGSFLRNISQPCLFIERLIRIFLALSFVLLFEQRLFLKIVADEVQSLSRTIKELIISLIENSLISKEVVDFALYNACLLLFIYVLLIIWDIVVVIGHKESGTMDSFMGREITGLRDYINSPKFLERIVGVLFSICAFIFASAPCHLTTYATAIALAAYMFVVYKSHFGIFYMLKMPFCQFLYALAIKRSCLTV